MKLVSKSDASQKDIKLSNEIHQSEVTYFDNRERLLAE